MCDMHKEEERWYVWMCVCVRARARERDAEMKMREIECVCDTERWCVQEKKCDNTLCWMCETHYA